MKRQILYTEITKAAEDLAQALRRYSDAPMYAAVSVVTRDSDRKNGDTPDFYTLRVNVIKKKDKNEYEATDPIIAEAGVIHRDEDGQIAKVERVVGGDA